MFALRIPDLEKGVLRIQRDRWGYLAMSNERDRYMKNSEVEGSGELTLYPPNTSPCLCSRRRELGRQTAAEKQK